MKFKQFENHKTMDILNLKDNEHEYNFVRYSFNLCTNQVSQSFVIRYILSTTTATV